MPMACELSKVGCAECDTESNCLKCIDIDENQPHWHRLLNRGFTLKNGDCSLHFEEWFDKVGLVLIGMIVVLIIVGVIGKAVSEQMAKGYRVLVAGETDEKTALLDSADTKDKSGRVTISKESIQYGVRNYLKVRMMDWSADVLRKFGEPQRFPFLFKVHRNFLLGVGLPLFLDFHFLVFLSSAATAMAVWAASRFSGITEFSGSHLACKDDGGEEACKQKLHESLQRYGYSMFVALGVLYMVLLLLCALFALGSRKVQRHYDQENSTMADYCLFLSGLPQTETNEASLKEKVEEALQCKGDIVGVSIGYDLSDGETNSTVFQMLERAFVQEDVAFHSSGAPLAKMGYGYPRALAHSEDLDEEKDKEAFCAMVDKLSCCGLAAVVFKRKMVVDGLRMVHGGMWLPYDLPLTSEDDITNLKAALLNKQSSPSIVLDVDRIAGEATSALAVGQREGSAAAKGEEEERPEGKPEIARLATRVWVGREMLEPGTEVLDFPNLKVGGTAKLREFIKIEHLGYEPLSVQWWSLGTIGPVTGWRKVRTSLIVAAVFLLLVLILYTPLAFYLANPYAISKGSPGFVTSQLQGILFGIAGNVLGTVNWQLVSGIGFDVKGQLEWYFGHFAVFTNFFNTLYFLSNALYFHLERGFSAVDLQGRADTLPSDFHHETLLFHSLYNSLVPGWLFSGFMVGKAMGLLMPLVTNLLLLRFTFGMTCLPDFVRKILVAIIPWNPDAGRFLSARSAEHVFQPPSVSLVWEYSNFIVMPAVINLSLFTITPNCWRIHAWTCAWVAFLYLFMRFVMLHLSKKEINANATVMHLHERLWGIPISIVALAWAYWGRRVAMTGTGGFPLSLPLAFLLSLVLHHLLLKWVGPLDQAVFDEGDEGYHATLEKLRYSWFNCNPVHVLKSRYCPEKLGAREHVVVSPVPFEYGKEYLVMRVQEANRPPSERPGVAQSA